MMRRIGPVHLMFYRPHGPWYTAPRLLWVQWLYPDQGFPTERRDRRRVLRVDTRWWTFRAQFGGLDA